jgi:aldehyde dehydrogenase (NAD+)
LKSAANYIAGEWIESTQAAEDINPSNTADVVGLFARADAKATERAIAAAKDAFPAWSRGSIQQRHDILKRVGDEILARKDELGRLLAREEGKTLAEGVGETVRAGQIFLFFAAECVRLAGERRSRRCGRASTSRSRASRSASWA